MIRGLAIFAACLILAGCGGGGGGGSSSSTSATTSTTTTTTTTAPALTNFATVTVDQGPAVLNTGAKPYIADNSPYVSVTLCAPGSTTNCQTIDHVLLDTGSVGLRIYSSVINASLLSALTIQTDTSGNSVGECYGFVDGYIFGAVRQADFQIGGETVSKIAFQTIGDSAPFATAPSSCTSGGGSSLNTVQSFGANGVLGVGVTKTDCGTQCTVAGGYGAAIYYDCPTTGCSSIIARTSTVTAPFQQLPNPVAAMTVDNNGTIISLPTPASTGSATLTGTVYFGIGTETNNGLGSATVLTTSGSSSTSGAGLITAVYNGKTLSQSFLDSGTNLYIFADNSITTCATGTFAGYYCPASALTLSATLKGANGATTTPSFVLNNASTLLAGTDSALPGIGGGSKLVTSNNTLSNSFDFGLTFFYGRNIYTAIEGLNAGGTTGPYFAF